MSKKADLKLVQVKKIFFFFKRFCGKTKKELNEKYKYFEFDKETNEFIKDYLMNKQSNKYI